MKDIYAWSNTELVKSLGRRFKTYRIKCRMTQKEVAEQSGISVPTIRSFENGRSASVSLLVVVALLRAIGQLGCFDSLLPEIPESPKDVFNGQSLPKRVCHGK